MNISIDTRTIQPGDIYIPVKGPNFDGHDFIPDAIKKGAAKVLDVRLDKFAFQYRKKLKCSVIAVTGSAGKTTVKDLVYYALRPHFNVIRTEENQNNEIGVPLTILRADFQTEIIIVEMGMRSSGEIGHLARIARPTHAIITNIGYAHIERLKTQRGIAVAKSEIFQKSLKWEGDRWAYINSGSPYADFLSHRAQSRGFRVWPFSGIDRPDQNFNICYAVANHFGLSDVDIQKNLAHFQTSCHRWRVHYHQSITVIDDSYNANPDAYRYVFDRMRSINGRKLMIAGDMLELGSESNDQHGAIIQSAFESGIEIVFGYGPHFFAIPSNHRPYYAFTDRDELHALVLAELKPKDTIIVKGSRGMRMDITVDAILERLI